MKNTSGLNISNIIQELDEAVLHGDLEKADELTALLYRLQDGKAADAAMPDGFAKAIATGSKGGQKPMSKGMKKLIYIAAAAVLVTALSVTALATDMFGLRSLVIGSGTTDSTPPDSAVAGDPLPSAPPQDLIVLQGYPDSNEYKASREWNEFLAGYDTDHAILNEVGNTLTEFYDKYPMYLVYSQDMADKLEEITAKYSLTLHRSMTIVGNAEELYGVAGTGRFLVPSDLGGNAVLGGYVYDDGTFHYDGQAMLAGGTIIGYQLGNYVKGTFSDTYLNVGDAGSYKEWAFTTTSGLTVSLALGADKALVIAELEDSFVTVNVLAGTNADSQSVSGDISEDDLEAFANLFDFKQIDMVQGK
jgi:hypothetical protein